MNNSVNSNNKGIGNIIRKLVNNKLLLIGIIVIIGVVVFLVLNRNNIFKNGILLGGSNKPVVKDITVNNNVSELTVVSSRIEKLDKVSSIYVKVKNNTESEISETDLKLTIYDKDDKVLLISNIYKVDKFGVGDEREFQVSTANDISAAAKYVVEKAN